jgi:hypothetical protein
MTFENNLFCVFYFSAILLLSTGATVFAEAKLPVFSDGFDTAGLLAENYKITPASAWRIDDGRLVVTPAGGATAVLKKEIPPECEVVFDITPLEIKKDFAGVIFHGINFLIRPDGFWYPYRVQGMDRALGGLIKADVKQNQKYQFRIVSRKVNAATMFSWFVNDKKVAEFIESGKIQGGPGFSFFANKMPTAFDNLKISSFAQGEVSSNLLYNSSFEYTQDGYPLYWKLGDPLSILGAYDNIEKFWQVWALDHDKANVRTGLTSLRLESNGDSVGRSVQSHQAGISVNSPVTCSIYIKADTDDLPVKMVLWETYGKFHRQDFKVGKEWKRCQMVVKAPAKNSIRIGVELKAKGVIWLDDAQIELGETASKYEPSALDSLFCPVAEEKIPYPEKIQLKRLPVSIVLDGKIEDSWKGMSKTDKFFIKGKNSTRNRTEAFLGCDNDNLYLAFRCYTDDPGKLRALATEDNNGAIWTDDCIEIFIDPVMSRSSYFHLGFNSKGVKATVDYGNKLSRTDTWEVKTSINPEKKCWEAEVKLPLNMLGLNLAAGNEWGINLARNDNPTNEQSCTALTPRVNFHDAPYYGSILWPDGILRKFELDVTDLRIAEAVNLDNLVIDGVLHAGNGADKAMSIQFFMDTVPVSDKKQLALNDKNTAEFSVPCNKEMKKKDSNLLVGKIFSAEGEVLKQFEQSVRLEKRIDIYTQRNYYMKEDNAILVVNLNIPMQAGISGVLTVTDKDKKCLLRKEVGVLKRGMRIDVPIKSLPVGTYDLQFNLNNGGKLLSSASTQLMKRAYEKNGTQIDRERRCIVVDGKPFLVIAPLIQQYQGYSSELSKRVVRNFADAGFKTIMVVKGSHHNDFVKCLNDMLSACEEYGVKTILWPGFKWHEGAESEPVMKPFMKAPSLIAWLPVDEPELYSTPDKVIKCINEFRKLDPYHPAYMNNSIMGIPSRYADLTTDILSIDDYVTNRENRKVSEVLAQEAIMVRAGEKERKPSWMFLSGNNLHNHGREPSVGEQVAQSYGTIITGCTGMYYFMGQPSCKLHWEICKQINREILGLSNVIFSLEDVPAVAINSSSVISMTRKSGDSAYVITVNLENRHVEATVKIPDSLKRKGSAEVLFEGRTIGIKDGGFNDAYAPHQRHVYKMKIKD